ncbi:DUF3325 domain-containing protein [Noviherbaspirillum aerium]|uniref:DUF3325 domain-containing protein n=1 Tax=Noviherbaspirillum aerium TaxID=2588497 RepID=UPI00124E85C8|nr:DUF3325 domain-containing protein [Noviherbaspirillum aerium]
MIDAMFTVVAGVAIYLAFAWLALLQERHWESVAGVRNLPCPSPGARPRWQRCAALSITAGLMLCIASHGLGFGTILWFLLLAVCTMAVAFTLAWQPQQLYRVARLMSF